MANIFKTNVGLLSMNATENACSSCTLNAGSEGSTG